MNEVPKTKRGWRIVRRMSIALAVLATLIAIFYTEEDWRGRRALENCKREFEAHGVVLDWNKYIPPSVPDDQNFFTASTNIFKRFKQLSGTNDPNYKAVLVNPWLRLEITSSNSFPILDTSKSGPIVVAQIIVSAQTPVVVLGSNTLAVAFNDPGAPEHAQNLIRATVGQTISGAQGFEFSQYQLTALQPARILVQSQTPLSTADLERFIPSESIGKSGRFRVVATVDPKIFQVTLANLRITAAEDYLAWSSQYVPAFNDIREALKRPYAILPGDYSKPYKIPIPNFVTMRALAQTLAQRAQCYFLLGEPDKALDELALVHDVCRILEKPPTGQPETLIEAMINVAITGLYVEVIGQGLQRHVWQEPQLRALQEQLQKINLLPIVFGCLREDIPVFAVADAETIPPQQWLSIYGDNRGWPAKVAVRLMPRGWIDQNVVTVLKLEELNWNGFDPADQIISPQEVDASMRKIQMELSHHHSPFYLLADISIPNFTKAMQTTAYNQTLANEAQIACALERCRLANGDYSDTLDALTPRYIQTIPQDIMGGQPLHYRRTADGKFLLYSIGWNEKDYGGQSSRPVNNGHGVDRSKGDWVWEKWEN